LQRTLSDAVIITVRNSSSRLPNKAFMKIKENLTSIDIVIERAKKTKLPVILATSTDSNDDVFEQVAREHNIEIFRGSLVNKIKRWYDCFLKFKINHALFVDGDDISSNNEIGLRALSKLKSNDLDIVGSPDNIVTGFFTYAISKSGLLKIYDVAPDDNIDTEIPARYIEKAGMTVSEIELNNYECNKNIRLTLDYEDDLHFFRTLYDGIDILESGKNIILYLEKNKSISEINFHRQKDFLNNQEKFNQSVT
jgi:spore coat polysaccharide biosynthesis protein SpsF